MSQKKILFILRSSPYGSAMAQEGIDAVLAASVFNQKISVLFMDEGLWQLHQYQQSHGLVKNDADIPRERKNIAAQIESFPLYDIDRLFIDEKSLHKLNLEASELIMNPTELTESGIKSLLAEHQVILSY
jgi:tRNA 2-thiouridine synthesizing protein C